MTFVMVGATAMVWAAWPQKPAKVAREVTEATVRALALLPDFVAVQVGVVNNIWSGLKLVVRKEQR